MSFWKSFFEGVGGVLDIFGTGFQAKYRDIDLDHGFEQDAKALENDWRVVIQDLEEALKQEKQI